jgi:hypothetical protein
VLLDALRRGQVTALLALPSDNRSGGDAQPAGEVRRGDARPEESRTNGDHGGRALIWPLALLTEPTRAALGTGDPLRLRVRYLVVADGPTSLDVLDRALLAVLGRNGMLVVPEAVPLDTWRALGAVPQAALLIDVPAQLKPAADTPAPTRVLSSLRLDTVSLRPLHGQVVGDQGVPLAGVRIEATGTGRAAYTDARGGFTLAGLPDRELARLVLFLRDRQLTVDVDPTSTEPVLIHCNLKEV